jgi:hypothetical protein
MATGMRDEPMHACIWVARTRDNKSTDDDDQWPQRMTDLASELVLVGNANGYLACGRRARKRPS